jgi:GST-like protein
VIDLYYCPTPNGWKISIMLEDCGLPYTVRAGEHRPRRAVRAGLPGISPNNRIPAIVDQAPADGGEPVPIFETGAILVYLAEKTGRLLPTDLRGRHATSAVADVADGRPGSDAGPERALQAVCAREDPYAIDRYEREARAPVRRARWRSWAGPAPIVAGDDYGIADMAIFPWIMTHKAQGLTLDDYPHIKRWFATVRARPMRCSGAWRWARMARPAEHGRCRPKQNLFGAPPAAPTPENPHHDRVLLRLQQPLDLAGLPQPAADGGRAGVPVDWRPVLVGGIFNAVNPSVYEQPRRRCRPSRRYLKKDLQDWARHSGVAIRFPPRSSRSTA